MHDGPLGRGFSPAAFGFFLRKFNDFGDAKIAMKFVVHDEDTAPDDVAGLRDSFHSSTAEAEVHRWLAFAGSAFVTADEMRRRGGAGDEKNPNVSVQFRITILLAPAQVVEGVLG